MKLWIEPFPPRRSRRRVWLAPVVMAAVLQLAAAGPLQAADPLPSIEVDLGALDQLGPPKSGTPAKPIVLRPPAAAPTDATDVKATAAGDAATAPEAPEAKQQVLAPSGAPAVAAAGLDAAKAGPASARIVFGQGSAELPESADDELAAIVARMKSDSGLRAELRGYATGADPASRGARRLALSRALAVRLYLTQQGIGGSRALVRALGSQTDEAPFDRVDVVLGDR